MQTKYSVSFLAAASLLLAGAGCASTAPNSTTPQGAVKEPVMEVKMAEEKKMGETMAKPAGQYVTYESSKLAMAANGPVVLFFHAPWCPSCKTTDADIVANIQNIPAGTTILKVDYDSNPELKKKYGVTYQHTFVQVDAQGTMLTKWSGSNTLASLLGNIKQ